MSPKNKGKFGKAKAAIEETDEFVSGVNRLIERLKPYAKQLLIGGAVLLVAVVAAVSYNTWRAHASEDATAYVVAAVDALSTEVMSDEEAELFKSLPQLADLEYHASAKERAAAALAEFERLYGEFGDSDAAAAAELLHAAALYDAEDYAGARAAYGAFAAGDYPEMLRALARAGVARSIEAAALALEDEAARKAELEKALDAYERVQPREDGPLRDEALYHQARVLAALGRTSDAIARYNEVIASHPATPLRGDINQRLALLGAAPADAQ
ncbi:MAG: hypothetical protein D6689_13505 [Deltaproteobacteria bacterium]|nr:MAG: hypothetical protein D6689_13505 [Deltaproteobacteria bacterium]